jgi:hypothetical protein
MIRVIRIESPRLDSASRYKARYRRRKRFSALIDCRDRNARRNERNVSTTNWLMIPEAISIGRECHNAWVTLCLISHPGEQAALLIAEVGTSSDDLGRLAKRAQKGTAHSLPIAKA